MTAIEEQLSVARLYVERAYGPYDEARKERNRLVKQAMKEGMRPAHAARLAGISREAAGKLR